MAIVHNQLVLVEQHNCAPYVENFQSTKGPITLEQVVKYKEDKDDFNWDRDSVTFIDPPEEIELT